jgi:hypothetical protein
MKRMLIRYKTKPEKAQENARLIEAVFEELRAAAPDGLRYVALTLGDGNFVHFVETADGASPLSGLAAFREFQGGVRERCLEPPQASEVTIVGNYRMLSE